MTDAPAGGRCWPRSLALVVGVLGVFFWAVLLAWPVWAQSGSPGIVDELIQAKPTKAAGLPETRRPVTVPVNEVQGAWKQLCAAQTGIDAPVVTWRFNPAEVRCIRTRAQIATTIILPAWENIASYNLGDSASFEVVPQSKRPNVLVVRPSSGIIGADTNLTVFGKAVNGAGTGENAPWGSHKGGRNVYSFYVWSEDVHSQAVPNTVVQVKAGIPGDNQFTNDSRDGLSVERSSVDPVVRREGRRGRKRERGRPNRGSAARDAGEEKPDYLREIPLRYSALHMQDYRILAQDEESREIAPVRVFHDGLFTILDFGEDGRSDRIRGAVVHEVVDGIDSMVDSRVDGPMGNFLIVHAIGNFTLRNGRRVVCIIYEGEGIAPGGKVEPAILKKRPAPATRGRDTDTERQTPGRDEGESQSESES